MKRLVLLSMAVSAVAAAQAQVLVSTGFEANSVGVLNGQTAGVPRPWQTGAGTSVVNTGPVVGTQAVESSYSLGTGASTSHGWVDLYDAPATGIVIPAGKPLVSSVKVYVDSTRATHGAGLAVWSNSGANVNAIVGIFGNGQVFGRNGVGTPGITVVPNLLANLDAWNTITIVTFQTDANTLTSTYQLNGVGVPGFTHTRTIATGQRVADVDLLSLNGSATTQTVISRYDDYQIEVVPEPATMAGLSLGVLALLRRRRSR